MDTGIYFIEGGLFKISKNRNPLKITHYKAVAVFSS